MITGVDVHDFRAFHHQSLELRPITVIVGENNSGKSSLLSAIRMLAQTIQDPDQSIPLAFNGSMGDFGSFRDVVHGQHRGRPFWLAFSVAVEQRGEIGRYKYEGEFKYRTKRRETFLRSVSMFSEQRPLVQLSASREADSLLLSRIGSWNVPDAIKSQMSRSIRMFNFLPRIGPDFSSSRSKSTDVQRGWERLEQVRREQHRAFEGLMSSLRNVEYVGSMRRAPERTYINTGVVGSSVGADGSKWPAALALSSGPRRKSGTDLVRAWAREAGIARDIRVSWLSDRHYEVLVEHPISGEASNIADVGQGTSQVLPVVVAGSRLGNGATFIVEEPEIHLHPRAQAALGDFFVGLHQRGVQSVIETHSEYLILRLQQHVAKGVELNAGDVVFYFVEATEGGKVVRKLLLDEAAAFTSLELGGFFPQRLDEAQKLVAARTSRSRK